MFVRRFTSLLPVIRATAAQPTLRFLSSKPLSMIITHFRPVTPTNVNLTVRNKIKRKKKTEEEDAKKSVDIREMFLDAAKIREHDRPINEQLSKFRILKVLDEQGKYMGELTYSAAQKQADNLKLDLVSLNVSQTPPLCQITDYKLLLRISLIREYEKAKILELKKLEQKVKELRFRLYIADHDKEYKIKKAVDLLNSGERVQFTVLGDDLEDMKNFCQALMEEAISKLGGKGIIDGEILVQNQVAVGYVKRPDAYNKLHEVRFARQQKQIDETKEEATKLIETAKKLSKEERRSRTIDIRPTFAELVMELPTGMGLGTSFSGGDVQTGFQEEEDSEFDDHHFDDDMGDYVDADDQGFMETYAIEEDEPVQRGRSRGAPRRR